LIRQTFIGLIAGLVFACAAWPATRAQAATGEASEEQIDSAPCMAAISAGEDDRIIAACLALIDNEKAPKVDRVKALLARAAAYERQAQIDRAISDYDVVLRFDSTLADALNARGELWRKKGDRPRALADFGQAVKLNPNHAAARANYKSLSLEIERIGAMMAINNKPSFNCALARRLVEKAICSNPELANLDREINAVNTKIVRETGRDDPRAGRAMQHEQDEFIARRNAQFGQKDYDLQKAMRERLDHLMALDRR
jgi:tetratricopeptide (TPR) repeat protein